MTPLRSLFRLADPAWLAARLQSWAPLPVRLIVGYGYVAHGYAKIVKHPEHFAAILQALGVPAPHLMAWATIAIELLGGLAVLAGAFVPVVAVPMLVVLAVASLTVHLPYGFTSIKLMDVVHGVPQFGPPGVETDLLYVAGLLALVFGGAGPFAVDGLLRGWYARLHAPRAAGRVSA
ncbi:DoxX family protein [Burkholderia perseverans]|uniref:DoxX family protein n=1 Tax=Burkholderia perseverans TaxID=2615214 RepID=UPI001FEF0C24|nr:DoxX family protein [Burkholderia perseverans]